MLTHKKTDCTLWGHVSCTVTNKTDPCIIGKKLNHAEIMAKYVKVPHWSCSICKSWWKCRKRFIGKVAR